MLTRTQTIIARVIRLLKHDEFTHASLSLDSELSQMYSFGRRWTRMPFIGCFRKEEIGKGVYSLFRNIPCVVLELDVTHEQYSKVEANLSRFISHPERYGYNYRGLLGNILGIPMPSKHRFLCSEFVYHLCSESGIVQMDKPSTLVRPQNLRNFGKVIYSGNLNDLLNAKSAAPVRATAIG